MITLLDLLIENIENIDIELVKTKDNLSKSERLALSRK